MVVILSTNIGIKRKIKGRGYKEKNDLIVSDSTNHAKYGKHDKNTPSDSSDYQHVRL